MKLVPSDIYRYELRWVEVEARSSDYGVVEALYRLFGGTVNEKGYKELDSHIGVIYGDSMTIPLVREILDRLKEKKFASTNTIFGIGSHTYQYLTRDTFGFAIKATEVVVNDKPVQIFKDPATDTDKIKKSLRGRVMVLGDINGDNIKVVDGVTVDEEDISLLQDIYYEGDDYRFVSLNTIRDRLDGKRND